MANKQSQIPLQFAWIDSQGRLSQAAAFWLQQLQNSINANTSSAENAAANPTIISLSGDVSGSGAASIPTVLSTVNTAPGTYGSPSTVPVITVDSKGRVISVIQEPISTPSGGTTLPAGSNGQIQYNSGGIFGAASALTYNDSTGVLATHSAAIDNQITFTIPSRTLNNLLPAQASNGGKVLSTDGTNAVWVEGLSNEFIFNYGDATPKLLMTVPAGKMVLSIVIYITTGFNGSDATISIGDASNYSSLVASTDTNIGSESNWTITPGVYFGSDTEIFLTINASGSTQGSGLIVLQIQE